jgi:uncharacterized protein involved in exopolysaccharide biosynthesis
VIAPEKVPYDDEVDLGALWVVLTGYKVVIASVAAVCVAVAVVVALVTTPVYRAEVVITEVRDNMSSMGALAGQLGGLASLAGVNLADDGPGRDARALLQSRGLVEAFITRYKLLPELYKDATKAPTMWLAVRKFRDSILAIREDTRKGVTTVSVTWTDAEVAARWANDIVGLVNELLRARAIEESRRNIAYLNEQIAKTSVVELQRVMYNLVETETKTLMLANVRQEYAFQVVDPAVAPEVRIRPKRTLIVLFGLVLGVLAGAGIALLHNSISRRRPA